ncbi:hypothetical protein TWF281_009729 [Arthrobotrys megalospora]
MVKLELLDMPLEVVSNVFEFLPGQDKKNLALTCSAVLNIVAPTLYSTVRLFYDESQPENGFGGLPQLIDVDHLISSPRFPLGYARRLSIERNRSSDLASLKRGPRRRSSTKEQNEFAGTADRAIELILNRFKDGQLDSIRLDYQTTYKTFALICGRQKKLRTLSLGDFKPGGLRSKFPNKILTPGSLTLESLEIREIDERVGCLTTVFRILNQNSTTLRTLRIGDPTHPTNTRSTVVSYARLLRTQTNVPLTRIDLPALERISIVHDYSNERFWNVFQRIVHCGKSLSHIRISCSADPYILIQQLVARGANGIESIQTNNCRRYTFRDFQGMMVKQQLPRIYGLETLQMQMYTHEEGEFEAAYASRQTLKRLWLRCSSYCDPKKCLSMSGILDYSTNTSLSSDKWPLLEELAIGAPQWASIETNSWFELPMLRSLKVLRLLRWDSSPFRLETPLEVNLIRPKIEAYVDWIHCWCGVAYEELPNLRVIVVETAFSQGCPGTIIRIPFYFVAYYSGESPRLNGTLPFIDAIALPKA